MTGVLTRLRNIPVTIRVPLVVATLMFVVAAIISQQVLNRLARTQTEHLSGLTNAYLDGLSASVSPHVLRKDIWEVFDALDRSKGKYTALHPLETIVVDDENSVIASSNPRKFAPQTSLPDIFKNRFSADTTLSFDETGARAYVRRILINQGRKIGTIYATLDISHLLHERRTVFYELVVTNLVLAIFLAAIGYFAVRRMLRPVKVLADHLEQGAKGQVEVIPVPKHSQRHSEFGRLFRNYNALATAVNERAELSDRLAREEHLASLGRLASGMAHEINNPLGGLFNAVETLKKHGSKPVVRKSSLNLLERGLSGIRDVVSAVLATYRPKQANRHLNTKDIDDMVLLLQPQLRRRKISLHCENLLEGDIPVEAAPVRQVALNLLLNAIAASPEGSQVSIRAKTHDGKFILVVADSGNGLSQRAQQFLTGIGEGVVPIVEGSGIGLWMVQRLIKELGGKIKTGAAKLGGAEIVCEVELDDQTTVLEDAA